jgi:hypothetical protein
MVVPVPSPHPVPENATAPASGLRQASDGLSKTPNPVDAVNLSREAVDASQHHIAYSLDIKAEKIKDEISSLAIDVIG